MKLYLKGNLASWLITMHTLSLRYHVMPRIACKIGIRICFRIRVRVEVWMGRARFGWGGQVLVRQSLIVFRGAPSFYFLALLVGYEAAR
jgi:hypothetical protein